METPKKNCFNQASCKDTAKQDTLQLGKTKIPEKVLNHGQAVSQ
jgi:hypothetical protein